MFQVEITELGRNDVSISKEFEQLNYNNLYYMVAPHLVSSEIAFATDAVGDGVEKGTVYVGFRPVGKIKITELKSS